MREKIDVDFQTEQRHGICRDIPLVTQDRLGVEHSILLTFLGATDETGKSWEATSSRHGAFRRIRFGSSTITYSGQKTFEINYQVARILQSFPDHDELYWNVTGNGWAVPIQRASARLRLPRPVPQGELRYTAYTGVYGSRENDVQVGVLSDDTLEYRVTRLLGSFEGFTIVAGWPSGLVPTPTFVQRLRWFFQDNWMFGIPLVTLLTMWGIWWRFGRDPRRGTIAVWYEPPEGLTPGEVGTLADDEADLKDVTATIIDLARRGFLTIEQLKGNDYVLTRRGSWGAHPMDPLKPHEALILQKLFPGADTILLSSLENEFYQYLPQIETALYGALIKKGFWWGRPDVVRKVWWVIAGLVAFIGILGMMEGFLPSGPSWPFAVSLWISGGLIAGFGFVMPRKTLAGARIMEQVLGLEEFLRRTDQDRLRRESNPEALFERMLPYAMALGVATQWAKAFEGIYKIEPSWYQSYNGTYFTPYSFTRQMNEATARMGTVLSSAPRSSGGSGFGGGFSGGGGGGGGGGAW